MQPERSLDAESTAGRPPGVSAPPVRAHPDRRAVLRALGLAGGPLLVTAGGVVGWRAWDQGVFEVGEGPAYAPWDSWREGPGLQPLIRAATLAPSPHNAQAWMFGLGENHIDLFADPTRGTGAVDPFLREMYVGLGAALENLTLSAWANGYRPSVTLMPAGPQGHHAARVVLSRATPRLDRLHGSIPSRRTNRYPFADRDVPQAALTEMSGLAGAGTGGSPSGELGDDVTVHWYTDPDDRAALGDLLVAATKAFIADPDQLGTDYRWFRQDWDDLQQARDGITVDAAGLSPLTAAMAKVLPPQSREATGRSWLTSVRERHTATARVYGIVAVRDAADDVHRIQGGRLLERIHLWTAAQGLALHHMNQITERADRERQVGVHGRFGDALDALVPDGWQALSTFRLGHPTVTPNRSPRRPVQDVIRAPGAR
jgi:hypothetical protein